MKYLSKWFNLKKTPQSAPIPGTSQVRNDNAGYVWAVDDWTRLDRFLILGSEGGSYYASERKLTRDNAEAVLRCIAADGARVVARIVASRTRAARPRTTRRCSRWRSRRSWVTSPRAARRTRRCRGSRASARTCSTSPSTSRRWGAGAAARCGRSRAGTTTWTRAVSRSRP